MRTFRSAFGVMAAGILAVVLALSGCGGDDDTGSKSTSDTPTKVPEKPKNPVSLSILDVAGNLQLTQKAIERYQQTHKDTVRQIRTTTAPAPELAGKIKAQQKADRLDIDMVLTGNDGLSAGIEQKLWLPLLPNLQSAFPGLQSNYLEPAAKMQELAQGQGIVVTYYPSGPLLEYAPDRVSDPPTTAQELLAWAKAHPKRFMYARPANSGPGRTLLMGLPYILGDKDPTDPENGWDKTWAYLKELGKYIEYYPSGTKDTMEAIGDGSRDMIATTTGWFINPKVLGTVPKEVKYTSLKGFTWVTDAHYMVVPRGIASEKLAVVLDLMNFLLKPEQQALTYDDGYFYPGPAVKNVPPSMAPEESQQVLREFGEPEFDQLIESRPKATPLVARTIVKAFDIWDREVGGQKVKEG